jgi:hypothetical protein
MRKCALFLLLIAPAVHARAADERDLGNWFNDPFVQVRSAFPDCPVPLGPLLTRAEMQVQEHSRVERGTRCYFEGKCSKPNSYLYDPGIAQELSRRFARSKAFAHSALWITVQRRFVWVEGCVRNKSDGAALEAFARKVPDVQLVLVNVASDPQSKIPYQTLEKAQKNP